MLITDKTHEPTIPEISAYINNPLFDEFYAYLESEYKPKITVEYSGDKVLLGWNVKFRKAGRALCTLYPFSGYFKLLIVIGKKEKERVEQLLPGFSPQVKEVYSSTKEGMGQRWLIIEISEKGAAYEDICELIAIRRASK